VTAAAIGAAPRSTGIPRATSVSAASGVNGNGAGGQTAVVIALVVSLVLVYGSSLLMRNRAKRRAALAEQAPVEQETASVR
jgi:hypothetical protein